MHNYSNSFVRESVLAERLCESLDEALPKAGSMEKTIVAMTIINTISSLPASKIADFYTAMLEFSTLTKQRQENVLSQLKVKITELKIGT